MALPLAIIPSYLAETSDVAVLETTVRTLMATARDDMELIVVDDCSPNDESKEMLRALSHKWGFDLHEKDDNTGFSTTVNVGLQRALDEKRHAILVNADLEFRHTGWVGKMASQRNISREDGYAWVTGALLSFPNGLIQHGGVYFSLLTRSFDHLWKFSPENLAEALVYRCVPVTGALQFIRHECLTEIGLYDETFSMAFEDVDYCLRVFMAHQECVFNPLIQAYHHESLFRGRGSAKVTEWTNKSLHRLMEKWSGQSFAGLVPVW